MVVRRLLSVLAVLGMVGFIGALPAQAGESGSYRAAHHGNHHGDHHGDHRGNGDGHPSYPPKPPSLSITKTTVKVGGTAVVMLTGCQPKSSASVVVTVKSSVVFAKQVKVNGAGQASTPIKFTVKGTNLVTVTCVSGLGQTISPSVTVTVVSSSGHWGDDERGHDGTSSSTLTRSIRMQPAANTTASPGDAVPLALTAGAVLLLGTGSGLVFTSRRRHRRPRHAYTR
jgi:hypothetical protein